MNLSTNPNTHWSSIFVDELARCGVEAVCIAPGSRSTPLTLAFADCPDIRIYRHLDERSAGFFALGMAMASGKPVALVCTSGTAAANFHPAVIEAYYSHIPLLVFTADRPAELRGSGANQTIDQVKMFGDHVLWSVEMPTPQDDAPDVVLRHIRTMAARACSAAAGLRKGPVHLNFPFRKPLEPKDPDGPDKPVKGFNSAADQRPFTSFTRGKLMPEPGQVSAIVTIIRNNPRGLIICGPDCPGNDFAAKVVALAKYTGYPILADPLSNLRHGAHVDELVLGGYHTWLPTLGDMVPDLIIRFGAVPTSITLSAYLETTAPENHIHVREDGLWADDLHLTHTFIQCDPTALCEALIADLDDVVSERDRSWASLLTGIESRMWRQMKHELHNAPFFDGAVVARILTALPEGSILFIGNSMPIRHVDTFDRPSGRPVTFFGNRGASGIDGNVSTALGLAAATGRHVTVLLGDITFYHDMNGLLAVRQHELANVTFIVLNNNGGAIFHRLPIARHDPPFTELFLTPHGLTFEHAAAMYGLRYTAVQARVPAASQLAEAIQEHTGPQLVEIMTSNHEDYLQMSAMIVRVRASLIATEPAAARAQQ